MSDLVYYLVRLNMWTATLFWIASGICVTWSITSGWEELRIAKTWKQRLTGLLAFIIGCFSLGMLLAFSVTVR